jgi:hypothetical protein
MTTSSRTRSSYAALLAALACAEVAVLASGAADGVRYGVGAVVALAIVALVARFPKAAHSH